MGAFSPAGHRHTGRPVTPALQSNRVRILPEETINRVAAGEVVERPAAALKELLENGIDAGAVQIAVDLARAGKGLIRVGDDGCGMSRDDLLLAIERHATSKIAAVEDLAGVATYGFRGEALPSIAAVSRLTIETRERGAPDGTRLEADGGRILRVAPCGCPEGTLVEVRDLFHTVPARLKFLRTEATELGHCIQVASRLALACPGVGLAVRHGERDLLRLAPAPDAGARLRDHVGREFFAGLVPVRGAGEACSVSGFVSRPGAGRPGAEYQQIFVNGRPVRDPLLAQGLREACRDHFLQEKSGVSYFLWLNLPAERVDVNVHPTKREVRLRDPGAVRAIVGTALREALRADSAVRVPVFAPRFADGPPPPASLSAAAPATTSAEPSVAGDYAVTPGVQARLPLGPEQSAPGPAALAPDSLQLFGTFIVRATNEGLVLVDQHAAHERILYERFLARPASGAAQHLLEPVIFDTAPGEEDRLEALRPALETLGVVIEPIGPRAWRLLALPAELDAAGAVAFVREMSALALAGESPARVEDFRHRAAALLACHTAVRANQHLGPGGIAALLTDLARTGTPGACPHGRPTSITIDRDEIQRRFKRT
ncbi:MAG: DNA mismatch repair endonuclease MutL [Candidatus Methylomirabilia bacterium]